MAKLRRFSQGCQGLSLALAFLFVGSARAEDKRNFVLALRTSAGQLQGNIEVSFNEVLKQNKDKESGNTLFNWEKVQIEPTDEKLYDGLLRIIKGDLRDVSDPNRDRAPGLKPYEGYWEIDLRDPTAKLRSLALRYEASDRKPAETVTLKFGGDKPLDKLLQYGERGRFYVDRKKLEELLKSDRVPKSYQLTLEDGSKEGKLQGEQEVPRPKEKYWLATLRGFSGSEAELFKRFKENKAADGGKILANEVPDFAATTQLTTIGVGAFTPKTYVVNSRFDDRNNFIFAVPLTVDVPDATVAWMLFPLSEEEAKKQSKELANKDIKKIIADIRKSDNVVTAKDGTATLKPDGKARWYEIPKAVGYFERAIRVEDLPEWKKKKGNESWRIIVWQFREGDAAQAYLVAAPGSSDQINNYVDNVKEWPAEIQRVKEVKKDK